MSVGGNFEKTSVGGNLGKKSAEFRKSEKSHLRRPYPTAREEVGEEKKSSSKSLETSGGSSPMCAELTYFIKNFCSCQNLYGFEGRLSTENREYTIFNFLQFNSNSGIYLLRWIFFRIYYCCRNVTWKLSVSGNMLLSSVDGNFGKIT